MNFSRAEASILPELFEKDQFSVGGLHPARLIPSVRHLSHLCDGVSKGKFQVVSSAEGRRKSIMPLQNRIDPFGYPHAVPQRGCWMGNRGGCFHRKDRSLRPQHWVSRQWIYCLLDIEGRRRALMSPGRYTELFFLDEVTALAAGHRPCFECQRERAKAFKTAAVRSGCIPYDARANELDRLIAGEMQNRLSGRSQPDLCCPSALPDGSMFSVDSVAILKWREQGWIWSFDGYQRASLPDKAFLLTPALTLAALEHGFVPQCHPSADIT